MGKLLGAHASDELDRPDLNKCPDCLCFFAGDNCPLCGKECPEEMRAGNRAKVKPKKKKINPNAGRVTFIPWYHSWLFIILMMFVMPIIGIILLCTSPYRTRTKIIVVASIVVGIFLLVFVILPFTMVGEMMLMGLGISTLDDIPLVDTSLTQEEYIERCLEVSGEDFYKNPGKYENAYVKISCAVKEQLGDYYLCVVDEGYEILLRSYSLDGEKNFVAGDKIIIYGEGSGNVIVGDGDGNAIKKPCVRGAYVFWE